MQNALELKEYYTRVNKLTIIILYHRDSDEWYHMMKLYYWSTYEQQWVILCDQGRPPNTPIDVYICDYLSYATNVLFNLASISYYKNIGTTNACPRRAGGRSHWFYHDFRHQNNYRLSVQALGSATFRDRPVFLLCGDLVGSTDLPVIMLEGVVKAQHCAQALGSKKL